jgi:hypothetical protein
VPSRRAARVRARQQDAADVARYPPPGCFTISGSAARSGTIRSHALAWRSGSPVGTRSRFRVVAPASVETNSVATR